MDENEFTSLEMTLGGAIAEWVEAGREMGFTESDLAERFADQARENGLQVSVELD